MPRRAQSVRFFQFLLPLLALSGLAQGPSASSDEPDRGGAKFSREAAATFGKRCTACHTYGKGVKVGPDLKGVTERRNRDWLIKFIHGSSSLIKSGDQIATQLFAQFKQQRMPDWTDLSDKQINDILDYLAIGGPDIKPADERNAATATAAEIESGRDLFYGRKSFKYGAQYCAGCHAVAGSGLRGGSLGPDLTQTYLKYQDQSLTAFLRHPCFRWDTGTLSERYLTLTESFALKSFLHDAAMRHAKSSAEIAQPGQLSPSNRAALSSRTSKGATR